MSVLLKTGGIKMEEKENKNEATVEIRKDGSFTIPDRFMDLLGAKTADELEFEEFDSAGNEIVATIRKKGSKKDSFMEAAKVPTIIHRDQLSDELNSYWLETVIPNLEGDYFQIKKEGNVITIQPVQIKGTDDNYILLPTKLLNEFNKANQKLDPNVRFKSFQEFLEHAVDDRIKQINEHMN